MKTELKIFKRFGLICLLVALPAVAFADVVAPPVAGFEWLTAILQFLQSIPAVGAILAKVGAVVALVATVMTFISGTVYAFLKLPEIAARFAGAPVLADKIKALADKILPWLTYLSIFNAPKKP